MSEKVSFVINLEGTAYRGVLQLDSAVKNIVDSVNAAQDGFKRIGNFDSRKKARRLTSGRNLNTSSGCCSYQRFLLANIQHKIRSNEISH